VQTAGGRNIGFDDGVKDGRAVAIGATNSVAAPRGAPRAVARPAGGEADPAAFAAAPEMSLGVRRAVPWVVSVFIHACLILIGFVVTWSVVSAGRKESGILVVADFDSMRYDPLVPADRGQAEQAETITRDAVQDRSPSFDPQSVVTERLKRGEGPPVFGGTSLPSSFARFSPDPSRATARFVGLSATNARRIVYVIDASGSMIRSLPIVLDELERSLSGLTPEQEFGVVFFSRNEAVVAPPRKRLVPGTREEVLRVMSWINDNVIPEGRSSPVAALREALALTPDVIFLLSENITGSGEFEIDQKDLLTILDELNPVLATGRRGTQINCVQFLDPDPLDTLRKIAQAHGGERGFRFLDRAELGLSD
jgi:hypothetical protein